MKTGMHFLIVIVLMASCNKNDDSNSLNCQYDNVDWIDEIIEDYTPNTNDSYLFKARYQNKPVIVLGNCCALCNTVVPVYNCSGEFLGIVGTRDIDIPYEELTDEELIWPEDSICDLKLF